MAVSPRTDDVASERPVANPDAEARLVPDFMPPLTPSGPETSPLPAPVLRTSRAALASFALAVAATVCCWTPLATTHALRVGSGAVTPLELTGLVCALGSIALWVYVLRRARRYSGTLPLAMTSWACVGVALATLACIALHGVHPVEYLRGYRTGHVGSTLVIVDGGHRDEIRLLDVNEAPTTHRQASGVATREVLAHFRHTNRRNATSDLTSLGAPQLVVGQTWHGPSALVVEGGRPARDVTVAANTSVDVWATYVVDNPERPRELVIKRGHWTL